MANDTTQSKELTGRQDLGQAFSLGATSLLWGSSGVFTADGCVAGGRSLFDAVQGAGASEGTNRYAPPACLPGGGIAAFAGVLPGYNRPWPGTEATYRLMSAHPTLVVAMAATFCPIKAGEWFVEADKGVSDEAKQYVSDLLIPRRLQIVKEMLWGLVFGCRGFERVKEMRDGYWTLKRLKPLLPELTDILTDPSGHLAGLRQGAVTLDRDRVVVFSNDLDGDYYYGRSRHENCRRAWSNWLCDDDNLHRLATKAASVIPYVGYPPGEGQDADGKPVTNYDTAVSVARGMSAGKAVVFPNLTGLGLDDLRNNPDLAKHSLWHHGTIDMGDSGPTLMALLEKHRYDDNLLVRGWCKPERSMLEASRGGSRADSVSHGDIGVTDCDMIAADIDACVNEQVVDRELIDNGWEKLVGKVRIKSAPIIDVKKIADDKVLDAVVKGGAPFGELLKRIDMDAWLDRTGLPRSDVSGAWDGVMNPEPTDPKAKDEQQRGGKGTRELSAAVDPYRHVRERMRGMGHSEAVIDSFLNRAGRKAS